MITESLLSGASANQVSATVDAGVTQASCSLIVATSGSPSFSVQLQGSADGTTWANAGSAATAAGTTSTSPSARYLRAVLSGYTGPGSVTVKLGFTPPSGYSGPGALTSALTPAVVILADTATVTVDASKGNDFRLTLGGSRTIAAPSNPRDGQKITFEIIQPSSGGPCTVTWASGAGAYSFGSGSAPVLSPTAGAADQASFRYSSAKGAWLTMGSNGGF